MVTSCEWGRATLGRMVLAIECDGADPMTGPGAGVEPADRAEAEDNVDRFSLAREFGRLLQRGEGPADG